MKFGKRNSEKISSLKIKVKRKGFRESYFSDIYHFVLAISWFEFFLINTSLYLCMNLFFASLYYLGGETIVNADPYSYWDAFVFSFQTSTTIGYGYLRPASSYADAVVILDTLSGIIFVTITTGLAFAKFSRPTARVLFTDNCVVHPYQGRPTLMFRVTNSRDSHIADASIDAVGILSETSEEGLRMQRLYDLPLIRRKTPIFFVSWSVMHIIDEESPLFGLSQEELERKKLRIAISLTGIDDWSAQMVHTSYMYRFSDIIYDKKFADMVESHPDGSLTLDYDKFNQLEPL